MLGYIRMFPGTKKRNKGAFGCSQTGTRAHSPRPPFYETALLFPLEKVGKIQLWDRFVPSLVCFSGGQQPININNFSELSWEGVGVTIVDVLPFLGGNRKHTIREILMSVLFPPATLGPEMAAPILWAPGIFGSFCRKTPMPIKFLFLGGGGGGVSGRFQKGGGKCQFIFMGVGIFPHKQIPKKYLENAGIIPGD